MNATCPWISRTTLAQIPQPLADVDFAVDEECARYDECARLTPFVEAGKAVFQVAARRGAAQRTTSKTFFCTPFA